MPEEYNSHPQNWAIAQGTDGKMYFGTNQGIVCYDGEYFSQISLNGIRAMKADSTGKIYVGADNELGYLYRDSLGNTNFRSLRDQLPEELKEFYTVLSIFFFKGDVYFIGLRAVFKFHEDKYVKNWTPETDFRFGFEINNRIFIRQNKIGLMELKNDSLQLIPGTEMFKDESLYFMLPLDEENVLLGTRNQGLFLASMKGEFKLSKFRTTADDYILAHTLYHGILLENNNYALVTNSGGVVIIDKNGKWIQLYNKSTGLAGNAINYVFCDREKNLWLASNNGVYFVETNTPITYFDEETGLYDLINIVKRCKKTIYAGTLQNLFYLKRNEKLYAETKLPYSFMPVSEKQNSYMDFIDLQGELICATATDICKYKNGTITSLDPSFFNFLIYPSKKFKGRLYIGCGDGIKFYDNSNNKLVYKGYLVKCNGEVRFINELENGDLIFIENYKKLFRLKYTGEKDEYNIEKENIEFLPDTGAYIYQQLYRTSDLSFLTINQYPFYFNVAKDSYVPADFILNQFQNSDIKYFYFSGERKKSIFFSSSKGVGMLERDKNADEIVLTPFMRLPVFESLAIYDDTIENTVWVCMPKGAYCYNYSANKNYPSIESVLINKIKIAQDSVICPFDNQENIPEICFDNNSLSFYYALPFYENVDANEYSCYLEGFSKEWSDWSPDAKVTYTNLHPGYYVFKVKARNCYKAESKETLFHFEILPPWYMKWYAYVFYLLVFLLIIYLAIKIYGKQLKAKNIKLEKIIEERTAEINEKNIELETQNKLITDSIHYAKHIQDAILPNPSELKTLFNDAFVFFLPRDIVSGDFYWFSQQDNKIFIAAGDCTGHGVPGSLMSMMGNTLLNEIVNEKKIYSPAKIFDNLNNSVITLLNQNIEGELTREDGMDISLFCYDTKNKFITIASANHKVIVICDGKEQIIKGDIYSIGGMFSVSQTVGFTDHVIPYKPGTAIYLFSDGYYDQFGGKDNLKFMLSNFEKFLIKNSEKTMDEQLKIIKDTFDEWKGTYRQIDDILVIGIKI